MQACLAACLQIRTVEYHDYPCRYLGIEPNVGVMKRSHGEWTCSEHARTRSSLEDLCVRACTVMDRQLAFT